MSDQVEALLTIWILLQFAGRGFIGEVDRRFGSGWATTLVLLIAGAVASGCIHVIADTIASMIGLLR